MNEQWLTERILYHMEVAKEHLMRRRRVGADDEFVQTAILILPDGREQESALTFYDCCEQKICMCELSAACLELDASALIIRARALLLNTDRIKKELDVDGGDRMARRAAIARWVRKRTGDGRVVSLPSEYQKWCLWFLVLVRGFPALVWCNTTIGVVTRQSSSASRRSAWDLNFPSSANGGSELSR